MDDIFLDSEKDVSGSKLYLAMVDKNKNLLSDLDGISAELINEKELHSDSLVKIDHLNVKIAELSRTAVESESKHSSIAEENKQIRQKLSQFTDDMVALRNQNEETDKVKLLQSIEIT